MPEKDYIWATEALIKSRIFDVIILDLDLSEHNPFSKQKNWQSVKVYSRLQNALSKSNTALLFLTNNNHLSNNWHFYTRLNFQWAKNITYIEGLNGKLFYYPKYIVQLAKMDS